MKIDIPEVDLSLEEVVCCRTCFYSGTVEKLVGKTPTGRKQMKSMPCPDCDGIGHKLVPSQTGRRDINIFEEIQGQARMICKSCNGLPWSTRYRGPVCKDCGGTGKIGNNIWFTADLHLGHTNIIKYCRRPFGSAEEMNEVILERFNSVISPGDPLIS